VSLAWFLVQTESRAEYMAAQQLAQDDIEVFFPRIKSNLPRLGHADAPLFPGYLFLRFDPEQEWPSFRPAHRIMGLVNFGGDFPNVPNPVINDLKERLDAINNEGGSWQQFHAGEIVRIISHKFEGYGEVVERSKTTGTPVKVLLEFMGRMVPAHIPWENLESVDSEQAEAHQRPRGTRGGGRWVLGMGPRATSQA
jgi:transcriptional antiterminator RfaH